jgi:hypothetical protein
MPMLSGHIHLQATQSQTQSKSGKRVYLSIRTTDRPIDDRG